MRILSLSALVLGLAGCGAMDSNSMNTLARLDAGGTEAARHIGALQGACEKRGLSYASLTARPEIQAWANAHPEAFKEGLNDGENQARQVGTWVCQHRYAALASWSGLPFNRTERTTPLP